MASKYFLLLLPTLIYAKIEVQIVASQNDNGQAVHMSGSTIDLISDVERTTFGLTDEVLKKAVREYFGKRPSDVFLRSPTPWGDLYNTYNWAQVNRILLPQRGRILTITSEPSIILTQIFHNNSTKTTNFKAAINQIVQNTISSAWEKDGDLTIGQDIEYGVDIQVASVLEKTSFSYTSKWGESQRKSEMVTVGSQAGVSISLEPNQRVTAELYATRGTMKIQVDYEATLTGTVAVNFDETYKGHHFWSLDVNSVMNAADLKRSVKSSEIITVGFYSDSKVVIKDSNSRSILYTIPMDVY